MNLQIVLVHSLNSLVLEKYYIIGTICLNLVITLPPRELPTTDLRHRRELTAVSDQGEIWLGPGHPGLLANLAQFSRPPHMADQHAAFLDSTGCGNHHGVGIDHHGVLVQTQGKLILYNVRPSRHGRGHSLLLVCFGESSAGHGGGQEIAPSNANDFTSEIGCSWEADGE